MEPTKDHQLSKLLHEWQVENAPPALDTSVLSHRQPRWRLPVAYRMPSIAGVFRKSLWAAAVAGVVFLIVVTQAIPQTLKMISPPAPAPFLVDSHYVQYADNGYPAAEMDSTSYTNQNGGEVLLGRTIAGHPLETALGRTLDAVLPLWSRLTTPLTISSKELEIMKQSAPHQTVGVISGCENETCLMVDRWFFARATSGLSAPCAAGPVVGYETILGHSTIAVRLPLPNPRSTPSRPAPARITMWMAPDLGCFALRLSVEEQGTGGVFHLVSEKQALRVTVGP